MNVPGLVTLEIGRVGGRGFQFPTSHSGFGGFVDHPLRACWGDPMGTRSENRKRGWNGRAYAALVLAGTLSCSESSVCSPTDSTLSCCVKNNPFNPERCGATPEEAAVIFTAAAALAYAATVEDSAQNQRCIDTYVKCIEQRWTGNCYDCMRYCQGQHQWPLQLCAPRAKR